MVRIIIYAVFSVILYCNEFVYASDCDIKYVLKEKEKVKIADCKNRGLTFIPQNLPGDIKVLDMSSNRLKIIGNNSFVIYRYLQGLYLRKNQLCYLSYKSFEGLHKLEILDISENTLNLSKVYSAELFHPLKNLTKLDIRRNMPQPIDFVSYYSYPDHAFRYSDGAVFLRHRYDAFATLWKWIWSNDNYKIFTLRLMLFSSLVERNLSEVFIFCRTAYSQKLSVTLCCYRR
ncbi:LINGO [Mytilus coruscus]|uniref:LINGO n=1 Tax=Mytilus coruscus TaxID=42192 RepID=A0A6J8E7M6_MYTCO|nr:LINGO [Mytilus coruscus]